MATFTLIAENQFRGDQLVDEILQATGIDLGNRIETQPVYIPPLTIEILDAFVPDQDTHDAIQAVIDAHVPDVYYFPSDVEKFGSIEAAQQSVIDWKALPGWSDWSVEEAVDYIENNVTDLSSAKAVMKGMATVIIHVRDVVEWLYVSTLRDQKTPD